MSRLQTLSHRVETIERLLRIHQPGELVPGMLAQVRADIENGYGGLPVYVAEARAGKLWCEVLAPHRGGIRWPYQPGQLLPIGPLPHPEHRWLNPQAQAEWLQRFS